MLFGQPGGLFLLQSYLSSIGSFLFIYFLCIRGYLILHAVLVLSLSFSLSLFFLLLLFGEFGWSVIFAPSMIDFQTSKFCGIEYGIWPLFGVKHMIFLEEFSSQTCWEIGKLCFIGIFFLLFVFALVRRISCSPIFFYRSSLHLNTILLLSEIDITFCLKVERQLVNEFIWSLKRCYEGHFLGSCLSRGLLSMNHNCLSTFHLLNFKSDWFLARICRMHTRPTLQSDTLYAITEESVFWHILHQ